MPQVTNVVLVDNGSDHDLVAWNAKRTLAAAEVIAWKENRGIAAAHNAGIQWAKNHLAEFVLLMDQDSVPAPDMVENLFLSHAHIAAEGCKLAAIGPMYVNALHDTAMTASRVDSFNRKCRRQASDGINAIKVDHVISSGCLIPVPVIDTVGLMNEELFIDYVDIEWCFRATHCGYQPYVCLEAHMQHMLGDESLVLLGRKRSLHHPRRCYYQYRNALWMYKQPELSIGWKLKDAWRLLLRFGLYSVIAPPRLQRFRMMCLGLRHGLRGHMGK